MTNNALCMHLSSKQDVGFWLPSNENLQKIKNLYPFQKITFISKWMYVIQKMIKHKNYLQLETPLYSVFH